MQTAFVADYNVLRQRLRIGVTADGHANAFDRIPQHWILCCSYLKFYATVDSGDHDE